MAKSVFDPLRKNQKKMMALFTIVAMLSFVVLPSFMDQPSMDIGQQVVATSRYGEIRQSDVAALIQNRRLANEFVFRVISAAPSQVFFSLMSQGVNVQQFFGVPEQRSVVENMLMAKQAEQMGMIVGDDTITTFIQGITGDRVTGEKLQEIVNMMGTSKDTLYKVIGQHLLANRVQAMFLSGLQTTPAQRWDYFLRLRRRASVELLPLQVENFVSQVKDPSEQELLAFFDTAKDREPNPNLPDPGFKIPDKAALKYFRVDFEKFIDEKAISDEEIKEQYEKNKDIRYLYSDFGNDSLTEAPKQETPASDEQKEQKKEDSVEKKSESKESSEEKTDEEKTDSKEESSKESSEPKTEEQSRCDPPSVRSLELIPVSQNESVSPSETEPSAEAKKEVPAEDKKDSKIESSSDAKKDTPENSSESTEKNEESSLEPATSLGPKYLLPKKVTDGPKPKYDPLWKVQDQIRTELARNKANEKADELTDKLLNRLKAWERKREASDLLDETGKKGEAPKDLDFPAIAAELGVTAHETSLISPRDFLEITGLGESSLKLPATEENTQSTLGMRLIEWIYSSSATDIFEVAEDSKGNRFVVLKTQFEETKVPEFEEVKEEVKRVWKLVQAREKALEAGRERAEKARQAKLPLSEVFTNEVPIAPGSFSWLTQGASGMATFRAPQVFLGEVEGVQSVGEDFMRDVFQLAEGDVGVTHNHPYSTVYVVRIVKLDPDTEFLQSLFMASDMTMIDSVASIERNRMELDWMTGLSKELELTWVEQPDLNEAE